MTSRPIGVTGATGNLGGLVARRLADRGVLQRLVVRDPSRAPTLPDTEIVEVAGYHDGAAMTDALRGTDTMLLISGEEAPDRLEQHRTAVAAAAEAGVERIVYTSFLGAAPDATFTLARDHHHTEEAIRAQSIALTALRNSLYLDVLPSLAHDGAIRGPGGDGRLAPVARADIADVAVTALLEPAHEGATYEVTGPELLTLAEIAATLERVLDTPVEYIDETVAQAYTSRASYGAPDWQLDAWVSTYLAIARGEMELRTDVVERLTGRPPRSLERLLAEGTSGG